MDQKEFKSKELNRPAGILINKQISSHIRSESAEKDIFSQELNI